MINEVYTEQLLKKLVNEQEVLSSEELKHLQQVFQGYEGRLFIESKMQTLWQQSPMLCSDINFDKFYAEIECLLKSKEKRHSRVFHILRQCAASLFIPLLGFSIFMLVKPEKTERLAAAAFEQAGPFEQEYYVPAGTKSKVTLPDSTQVWLNAGSRLIVENAYGELLRKVRLAGEGYFEVSRNVQKPFVVQTYDMDVKVLGTTFNLSAYPDNRIVEAVLVEGSVEIDTKDRSPWWKKRTKLQPSQKLAINKVSSKVTVENNVKTDLYTAWKNNRLIYQDTPMADVAKSLERWFNVVVKIKDKELESYTYTGKFEDRSLAQILHFMQISAPIACNTAKDTVTIAFRPR